jgi:hypothetical protein
VEGIAAAVDQGLLIHQTIDLQEDKTINYEKDIFFPFNSPALFCHKSE